MLVTTLDDAPASAYVPALHAKEPLQDAVVNPVVLPELPAGQSRHVEAADSEYFPTPQILHPDAVELPGFVTVPA